MARYILLTTAKNVSNKAQEKHFISTKHLKVVGPQLSAHYDDLYDIRTAGTYNYTVGGRSRNELDTIAADRAAEIINQLPSLNSAVRIINPEVSKWIEQRDKILAAGKKKLEESQDLSGPLDINDLDQSMTVAKLQEMIKTREKRRKTLIFELDELGDEGRKLETRINKFLYNGLPGLSDAVVKVLTDYMDRFMGFSTMNRRVSEQVQFGDSEAAMSMLQTFEKDEVTISTDVKAQFDRALETLKLAAKSKKPVKKLG